MARRRFVLKDGVELTSALEKKSGAEAERGYDLSRARRVFLRPGRPAKGDPGGESPRVAFRIPPAIYDEAKGRAADEGVSLSVVVRELVAAYAAGTTSRVAARPVRRRKSTATRANPGGTRRTAADSVLMSPNSGGHRRTSTDDLPGRC